MKRQEEKKKKNPGYFIFLEANRDSLCCEYISFLPGLHYINILYLNNRLDHE